MAACLRVDGDQDPGDKNELGQHAMMLDLSLA